MANNITFNKIFKEVNACRARYRVLKGSAGSGKSVNVAQDFILKLMDPKYKGANLLVVRKVEESNRDSTFAELLAAAERICGESLGDIWEYRTSPLGMYCKVTGASIIFRGMLDARQREKVKSITFREGKLCWVWCEEATELCESDIDILDDRLRGELTNPELFYQLTLTFNPVSASHWIKAKFFDVADDEIFTHSSTYLDNRFIDPGYHKRMMLRRERDPEGYRVYGLGEWGEVGGSILTNWRVAEFDCEFDAQFLGQDFGFVHANAILHLGFRDRRIYVVREFYYKGLNSEEIIKKVAPHLDSSLIMFCDSAEPDRIKTWRAAGYRAAPVSKEPGCIGAQIDFLKRHEIIIHPSCKNTIAEISAWKWLKDPSSGEYTDTPAPGFDDAMAALRYGIEYMRKLRH